MTQQTATSCRPQRAGSPMARPASSANKSIHASALLANCRQRSRPLVGNFEENILNNRLQPDRVVEDYSLEVRSAPYSRCLKSKVRVSFYSAGDCFPYLGQAHIGHRAFKIPKKGTLQVTLFNPNGTLVKLFLLQYDLTDMPPNSQTFLRQKTMILMRPPTSSHNISSPLREPLDERLATIRMDDSVHADEGEQEMDSSPPTAQVLRDNRQLRNLPPSNVGQVNSMSQAKKRVKYMIQFNIVSSKSSRIYLNKDLRIFISKKVDLETARQFAKQDYELKSFDEMPSNPRYFSR